MKTMKKVKVSEASGVVLDWLVGMAQGYELNLYGVDPSIRARVPGLGGVHAPWAPSRYWNQGGPIMEREVIHTWTDLKDAAYLGHPYEFWVASTASDMSPLLWGPTKLIAAMRCYVASKLGDEIEVPEELL